MTKTQAVAASAALIPLFGSCSKRRNEAAAYDRWTGLVWRLAAGLHDWSATSDSCADPGDECLVPSIGELSSWIDDRSNE